MLGYLLAAGAAWIAYELFGGSSNIDVSLDPSPQPDPQPQGVLTPVAMTVPADMNLVPVVFNGEVWLVAPDYVGPIGINEAVTLARSNGFELPSPGLVDAIWRQADLKLTPMPRQNIVSQAVFDDQRAKIAAQVGGRDFNLLGGSFKDVVMVNGRPSIYGWHVDDSLVTADKDGKPVIVIPGIGGVPVHNPTTQGPGKIIQPFAGSVHDQPGPIGFKDYSQGARLVKRA